MRGGFAFFHPVIVLIVILIIQLRIYTRLRTSKLLFVLIVVDMVCMEDIPALFVTELDKCNLKK
ncbi:hypothetical protein DXA74_08860 [Bacteroides sp. OF04-15BH]|nr:hypothetical protein DXA74_08860 [Bacteroides sp. OF04-15BH]